MTRIAGFINGQQQWYRWELSDGSKRLYMQRIKRRWHVYISTSILGESPETLARDVKLADARRIVERLLMADLFDSLD